MPRPDASIAKKILPIFYVIDKSGSMYGDRISAVNRAMRECERILVEKAEEIADAEIRVGVLTFSNGAEWITANGLVSLDDFRWNDVEASGVTDLGAALKELYDKMSRSAFLKNEVGYHLPVIIFMSDGAPTDNWTSELDNINSNNKWFERARKIAIAIGSDADRDVLTKLVGNREAVVSTNDLETLKNLIKKVTVSVSMLASQSRSSSNSTSGSSILRDALGGEFTKVTVEKNTPSDIPAKPSVSSFDISDPWSDTNWP